MSRNPWADIEHTLSSGSPLAPEQQAWLRERARAVLAADDEANSALRPKRVTAALGLARSARGPERGARARPSNDPLGTYDRFGVYTREVSRACWKIIAEEPLSALNGNAIDWLLNIAREVVRADQLPAQERREALLRAAGLGGKRMPEMEGDAILDILDQFHRLEPQEAVLRFVRGKGLAEVDRTDDEAMKNAGRNRLQRRARFERAAPPLDGTDPLHFKPLD